MAVNRPVELPTVTGAKLASVITMVGNRVTASACAYFWRRRRSAASPTRDTPSSAMLAGSGTPVS